MARLGSTTCVVFLVLFLATYQPAQAEVEVVGEDALLSSIRGAPVEELSIPADSKEHIEESWNLGGSATKLEDAIQLTPDRQSKVGGLWNRQPMLFNDFEMTVRFRIYGAGRRGLWGDGFAFWLVDNPNYESGPAFGANDKFSGLGVFFDTYENKDTEEQLPPHPYVSAMINDNTLTYEHSDDGSSNGKIGACTAGLIRQNDKESYMRFKLRYIHEELTLYVDQSGSKDGESEENYFKCLQVQKVRITPGKYIGFSAATGHLADNHEILSVETHRLDYSRRYSLVDEKTIANWKLNGSAEISDDVVRLTKDRQSQRGQMWQLNPMPSDMTDWQAVLIFKIHGQGAKLFGDGIGLWLTTDAEVQEGRVFGRHHEYKGMGLFIDTYDNKESRRMATLNRDHPFISAVLNSGEVELGGCSAKIRAGSSTGSPSKLEVTKVRDELIVRVDVGSEGKWVDCFKATNVKSVLPPGTTKAYWALTSMTGHLADNHDIISFAVRPIKRAGFVPHLSFSPPPLSADDNESEPNANRPIVEGPIARGLGLPQKGYYLSGHAMRQDNVVRLTPDRQSKQGGMWSKQPVDFHSWEVHIHYQLHGAGKALFGDGFAMWMADEPVFFQGPLFGHRDTFSGLSVIFDTYNNAGGQDRGKTKKYRPHPYISAVVSDGSSPYEHNNEGLTEDEEKEMKKAGMFLKNGLPSGSVEIGGCHAGKIRSSDHSARTKVKYLDGILSIEVDAMNNGEWKQCFTSEPLFLPPKMHLGFSAATGHLADNHDLISVEVYNLELEGDRTLLEAQREQEIEVERKEQEEKREAMRNAAEERAKMLKELNEKKQEEIARRKADKDEAKERYNEQFKLTKSSQMQKMAFPFLMIMVVASIILVVGLLFVTDFGQDLMKKLFKRGPKMELPGSIHSGGKKWSLGALGGTAKRD